MKKWLLVLSMLLGLLYWLGPVSFGQQGPTLHQVMEIQRRNEDRILQIPGVRGIGIGRDRVRGIGNGRGEDQFVFHIFFNPAAGDQRMVPEAIGDVQVRVFETDNFNAYSRPTPGGGPDHQILRTPPVPGISTSNENNCFAGTIGFYACKNGQPGYITNNHVATVGSSVTTPVLNVTQYHPGTADNGCVLATSIGTLSTAVPILLNGPFNLVDAAFVRSSVVGADILDMGVPGQAPVNPLTGGPGGGPIIGLRVRKSGRTTGYTTGVVSAINVTAPNIGYSSGTANFQKQIMVTPGGFGARGDSGSPVVMCDTNEPVGLLFAGSSFGVLCNPIGEVLNQLGVSFSCVPSPPTPTPMPLINTHVSAANEFPPAACINETFCYTARLENVGSTGFGPYIRLVTPPEITLDSASFLNFGTAGVTVTDLGTFPTPSGNILFDILAKQNVFGPDGYHFYLIKPKANHLDECGLPIDIEICLKISDTAVVGAPLEVCHTPVYQFGNNATKEKDDSIVGDTTCDEVIPVAVKFRKATDAPPSNKPFPPFETPSGSCFPVTFFLIADICDGQTLTDLVFTDTLPPDLQFVSGSTTVTGPGLPTGITITGPSGGSGGTLQITVDTATGTLSDKDVVVTFQAYVVDILDPTQCESKIVINPATLDATYKGNLHPQLKDELAIEVEHLTLQKAVIDPLPPEPVCPHPYTCSDASCPTCQSTITYQINFQVSESISVDDFKIIDKLPDGLTFDSVLSLTVGDSFSITPTANHNTSTGETEVIFDISGAVGSTLEGCTTGTLIYSATVDQFYGSPPQGPVLASDQLINGVVKGTYDIVNGATNCSDDSIAAVRVRPVNIAKCVVDPQDPTQCVIEDITNEYKPGENVTFRLMLHICSGDTKNIVLEDFFPLPIFDASQISTSLDLGSLNPDIKFGPNNTVFVNPISIETFPPDSPNTNSIRIEFPDVTSTTCETLELEITVTVTCDPFADDLFLTNLFRSSTENTGGEVAANLTGALIHVRAPAITIAKDVRVTNPSNPPDACDILEYTITICNDGGAPAYDIALTDMIPAGLTSPTITGVSGVSPTAGPIISGSSPTLSAEWNVLKAGDCSEIKFQAQIDPNIEFCETEEIKNTAKVVWASCPDETLFPQASGTIKPTIAFPKITKTVMPDPDLPHTSGLEVSIGEKVQYRVEIQVPEGTCENVTFTDDLVPGLALVNIAPISVSSPTLFTGSPTPTISNNGQLITFNFGTVTNHCSNGPATIAFEYTAVVLNVPSNDECQKLKNQATWSSDCCVVTGLAPPITIVEPTLQITKVATDSNGNPITTADADDEITFTLTIENTGQCPADAFEVELEDMVPTGMTYNPGSLIHVSGLPPDHPPSDTNAPTLTASWTKFPLGATSVIKFQATLDENVIACQEIGNTATLTWTSLPGSPGQISSFNLDSFERTYQTAGSATVRVCIDPPSGLVGWWPGDGTPEDISGLDNDGMWVPDDTSATYDVGKVQEAFCFGSGFGGGIVAVSDDPSLNFGAVVPAQPESGDFSIDLWVKTKFSNAPILPLVWKLDNNRGYGLFLENGNLIFLLGDGTVTTYKSTALVADGDWHHVAVTVDRDNPCGGRLYVDCKPVEITSGPSSCPLLTFDPTPSQGDIGNGVPLQISSIIPLVIPGSLCLDEIEIFNRALDPSEIKDICECGKCKPEACVDPPSDLVAWWPLDEQSGSTAFDISDFKNHGTHMGDPTADPVGKVAGALSFDGIDDVVEVPDPPNNSLDFGKGSFTLDAYVFPAVKKSMPVIFKGGLSSPGYIMALVLGDDGSFRLGVSLIDGSINTVTQFSNQIIPVGTWAHVAVVVDRNQNEGRFYINGGLDPNTFIPPPGSIGSASPLFIGATSSTGPAAGLFFFGKIDEVEIFNRALSEDEIKSIIAPGKCKGAICGMKFNDLDGDGVKDDDELGLEGWTIFIDENGDGILNNSISGNNGICDANATEPCVITDKDGNYCFTDLAPDTYTVAEVAQDGWKPTTPPLVKNVEVTSNQMAQVDFGNEQEVGTIIIKKVTDPGIDNTTDFGFAAGGGLSPTNFSLTNGGMQTFFNVPPGSGYSVEETTIPAGWSLTSATCDNGSPVSNISVSPGQVVTCTFDNTKQGTIIINKTAVNGDNTFSYSGSLGNFSITTNGGIGSQTFNNVPPATVTVTEQTPPPGWEFTSVVCEDSSGTIFSSSSSPTATFSLAPGETITCTYTNTHCAPPPPGMVAWWPFDLDGLGPFPQPPPPGAVDLIPFPNNGTPIGGVDPNAPGKVGSSSYEFDGLTGYVEVVDDPSLNFGTGSFAIDAWICPDNINGLRPIVSKIGPDGNSIQGYMFFLQDGKLKLWMGGGASGQVYEQPPAAPLISTCSINQQWTHVAVSVRRIPPFIFGLNSQFPGIFIVDFYKDGMKFQASSYISNTNILGNSSPPPVYGDIDNSADLLIGRFSFLFFDSYFDGKIDELEIFKAPLFTADVKAIYQAGSLGKCRPPQIHALADLVPVGLEVNPEVIPMDGQAEISFSIRNQGEEETSPAEHDVQLVIFSPERRPRLVSLTTVSTRTLAPGASQAFRVPLPRLDSLTPTPLVIRVTADAPDAISESNEENNAAELATGILQLSAICGTKFKDLDGDGRKDDGEPGVPGWKIILGDAQGNVLATTTTDENGNYCFMSLAPGTYKVSEEGRDGWQQTFPPPPNDQAPGIHTVNLGLDQTLTGIDFGNEQVVNPCDFASISTQSTDEDCCWTLAANNNSPVPLFGIRATAVAPVTFMRAKPEAGWAQTPSSIPFLITSLTWTRSASGPIPTGLTQLATICLNPGSAALQEVVLEWLDERGNVVCAQRLAFDCPPAMCCELSPRSFDFGQVCVGQSVERTFTATNCGSLPFTINSITSSNPAFSIVSPALPVTVPAGEQVTINVRLTCTTPGQQSSTLSLVTESAAGPIDCGVVNITGTCLLAACDVSPRALDFGQVEAGQIATQSFTVRNTGNTNFTLNTITSSNPAFNVISPALPIVLSPGTSVPVTVQLTCATPGTKSGRLTFSTSSVCGLVNCGAVTLTGNCGPTACVTPPPDLIAWYPMDETSGTSVADIVGGNTGTHLVGNNPSGVFPVAGMVDGALVFGPIFGNVVEATDDPLDVGTGDVSLDAWIKPNPFAIGPAPTIYPIVDKLTSGGFTAERGYLFFLSDGVLSFALANGAGGVSVYSSTAGTIADAKWHHVAVTVRRGDPQGGVFYIDGSLAGTFDPTDRVGDISNQVNLRIGRARQDAAIFDGSIDEVEIFRRALSPSEVQAIFNAGSAGKCKPSGPPDLPDLVVENLRLPLPPIFVPLLGAQLTVTLTIGNRGTAEAGPATHMIFLAPPEGAPVQLRTLSPGPIRTGPLGPGASQTLTRVVVIPASLCSPVAACNGSIRALLDINNEVMESNEGNNTSSDVPIPTS